MTSLFPAVEGDENAELTQDFIGTSLSRFYDEILAIAPGEGTKSLNDFEYFDEDLLSELEIELEDEQSLWHSPAEGIKAIEYLMQHAALPDDRELRAELEQLARILGSIPATSKGWHLEHDI